MPRYVLHPGVVMSKNDGDLHYVGVAALRQLYRIPRDARVVTYNPAAFLDRPGDIHCRPRYDGRYPAFDA